MLHCNKAAQSGVRGERDSPAVQPSWIEASHVIWKAQSPPFDPYRRELLAGTAALSATAMLAPAALAQQFPTAKVNTTGLAVTDTEVTVGILHSVTGTMAISETGSVQAEKLAIEQINAQGGVLGRKIKFIQEDGASDWPTFAEKAKKLLVNDKVASVMGCWTSASRKAVLPVFEQYNGMLYYPTFYEGLEQSKNVIYTGQEATQQIIAGLDWVQKEKSAKTFYLLGSDYIWPRTSNKIARKHIENLLKLKVVGEEYFPLGHTQFNSVINKIKLTKPDVIYAIIVGGSNVAFYKQLKAAGFDLNKQTLLTISVTEDEIDRHRRREHRRRLCLHEILPVARQPEQQGIRVGVQEDVGRQDRHRRRDPGRLSRAVAVEAHGREGRLASTSTRWRPRRRASNSRARRKATSASTRTIISGARRASAARASTASTT